MGLSGAHRGPGFDHMGKSRKHKGKFRARGSRGSGSRQQRRERAEAARAHELQSDHDDQQGGEALADAVSAHGVCAHGVCALVRSVCTHFDTPHLHRKTHPRKNRRARKRTQWRG